MHYHGTVTSNKILFVDFSRCHLLYIDANDSSELCLTFMICNFNALFHAFVKPVELPKLCLHGSI